MTAVSLRPVSPEDDPFLLAVYASTRAAEMAMVPWDDAQKLSFLRMQHAAQRSHYTAHYPTAALLIIMDGASPVGRLWVDRQTERIHVLDLTVLPPYQGRGIGKAILQDLLAEASAGQKAVTIYVEGFNPSLKFLERLGFSHRSTTGAHLLMQWLPEPLSLRRSESP